MQNPYGPLELLGFGEIDLCVIAELQLKLEVQLNSRGCTEEGTSCHGFGYVCSASTHHEVEPNYLCPSWELSWPSWELSQGSTQKLFLGIILSQV